MEIADNEVLEEEELPSRTTYTTSQNLAPYNQESIPYKSPYPPVQSTSVAGLITPDVTPEVTPEPMSHDFSDDTMPDSALALDTSLVTGLAPTTSHEASPNSSRNNTTPRSQISPDLSDAHNTTFPGKIIETQEPEQETTIVVSTNFEPNATGRKPRDTSQGVRFSNIIDGSRTRKPTERKAVYLSALDIVAELTRYHTAFMGGAQIKVQPHCTELLEPLK